MFKTLILLALACQQSDSLLDAVNSQRGGRHWIDQEPAPPKDARESLSCFEIEPGSRVELVAAEPLVLDPVWIDFDAAGRLFVAEYADYPSGATIRDATPLPDAPPLSRIVLLEDRDGDGRMDQRTVFADQLKFCHSFLPLQNGLLAAAQTELIFLKDTDGDSVADVREVWFDGFTPAHPQMQIGCPQLGPDGYVYLTYAPGEVRCRRPGFETTEPKRMPRQDMRFDPVTMKFAPVTGLGQFGNTFTRDGVRLFSTNRNPIMMAVIPHDLTDANPFVTISRRHTDVGPAGADTRVYPLVDMKSNWLSHAGTHTAACGVTAYRGDRWDAEFQRSVFVCEPIGHLVTRTILEARDNSPVPAVRRPRPDADFLASTDTWFRPSSLRTGPDGALYLADMYRMWVEHPKFLPPDIAARIDWRAGSDRGRIWRIVPDDTTLPPSARLSATGAASEAVNSPSNAAFTDSRAFTRLQRILDVVRRNHSSDSAAREAALPELRDVIANGPLDEWLGRALLLASRDCSGELLRAIVARPEDNIQPDLIRQLASVSGQQRRHQEVTNLLQLAADESNLSSAVQTEILTGLADGLSRSRNNIPASDDHIQAATLAVLLDNPPPAATDAVASIANLLNSAATRALDGDLFADDRIAAIRLAAIQSDDAASETMVRLLHAGAPAAIQIAGLNAISPTRQPLVRAAVFDNWHQLLPAVRSVALNHLLTRPNTILELLDHMTAGTVAASVLSIDQRVRLLQHRDDAVRKKAEALFGGVVSADRRAVAEQYAAALTMEGSVDRGRVVFQRVCSQCHRMEATGHVVGPDISDTRQRSPDALLYDILDPNRRVDPQYSEYTIVTSEGLSHSGLLVSESADSVTLLQAQGKRRTVTRQNIDEVLASSRSLMPVGIEKDVTVEQMADLLAYLKR